MYLYRIQIVTFLPFIVYNIDNQRLMDTKVVPVLPHCLYLLPRKISPKVHSKDAQV